MKLRIVRIINKSHTPFNRKVDEFVMHKPLNYA
jgi:hypothetical protein